MLLLANEQRNLSDKDLELYKKLDKGIDDMESGHVIPHEEAIKLIKERIKTHEI